MLAVVSAPEAYWLVPKMGLDNGADEPLFNPMYVASYNGHLHVTK